jgi:hypothetical protein
MSSFKSGHLLCYPTGNLFFITLHIVLSLLISRSYSVLNGDLGSKTTSVSNSRYLAIIIDIQDFLSLSYLIRIPLKSNVIDS